MAVDNRMIGGVLLVSGTTIGAAMLALPVSTGLAGFIPTACLFVGYWALMTYTALLMLEVTLWNKSTTNLVSMTYSTLGRWGESVAWVLYLFLLYSLTTAYMAGSSPIFRDVVRSATGYLMPAWAGPLPLLLIFGIFVYQGTRAVDMINRILMIGLVVAFAAMVAIIAPSVEKKLLYHIEWRYLVVSVSLVATSFGFHIIIPTLTAYMDHDVAKLRRAILIGSVIPLFVYMIWNGLALGVIPISGPDGIINGYTKGSNGVQLLTAILGTTQVTIIGRFFLFFAIVTSFLGVSLSLRDFLADGLGIEETPKGRVVLYLLTFFPPLIVVWTSQRAFLSALEFAGAFGVVTLLGILPAMMAWSGRYKKKFLSEYETPGGKPALVIVMIVCICVIFIEIINKIGLIE
ncbi:MAG: tyrosine transporter [Chlamydiales bacterium]|nr:tyrosine transporter [Chlamydiia bacterium]MCP5508596.1 tyrosine transporter [Chlamydiales bacterium]